MLTKELEDRKRQEEAEMERRRQIIMAKKLEDLRKRKQEMVEHQRLLSLQR